ncbi:methyltransferase domain-containing protein [Metabacillus sp. GX 13764]|uniref:tRNA (mnm(5)s(2)U34)-methyltransferase n=1 Tax=Metabacillus kandeliae TaxID=2900151 RepID=UPI001E62446A|nr:class I SAM-dependent methyltransferase [Metabacillus kandeliae]MCD7032663.1 methyltransferase domain-containing protein [Metabacillus kandeliae]
MKLDGILPFCRKLLAMAIHEGDIAVDATAGNGHDTVFLAKAAGDSGHVHSFDIQETAIQATKDRINKEGLSDRATLHLTGHENIQAVMPEAHKGRIGAAVFNLGYLPGSDKSVVTKPETTIRAIDALLPMLKPEGIIVLVVYHGHAEGKQEKSKLLNYTASIDQKKAHVLQYQFINQSNDPPFIIAIEKRG